MVESEALRIGSLAAAFQSCPEFGLERGGIQTEHSRMGWLRMLLLLVCLPLHLMAEDGKSVVVVALKGEVNEAQFFFLRRAIKNAEREEAGAFVLEMETYGGDLKAAIEVMNALMRTKLPTVTYVNNRAISAGALIALATQRIYMAPGAVIGAAAPVLSGGQDLPKTMADKTVSATSAIARAAAQKNGRNPDLAEAFINKEKEFKIGEVILDGRESLLTLSAEEASRVYGGKPLLSDGIANSLEEVLRMAGIRGPIQRIEPTGFEHLAIWVTTLAPLLLLVAILCGYIETKIPGFGFFGGVSIFCFALFFAGHYLAGLAGWEAVVLFVLGLALICGELLIHPGTILPGVLGILLLLGSLIYAMVDRWPGQPIWPSSQMLWYPVWNVSVALFAAVALGLLIAKYLPKTSFYRHIVLFDAVPAVAPSASALTEFQLRIGDHGRTQTDLRPSGKAVFAGQLVDVVSRGSFIAVGAEVRVVEIEGARVAVEAV